MIRNENQAASWPQVKRYFFEPGFNSFEFMVDKNTQGLKYLGGGMNQTRTRPPMGNIFNQQAQLYRRLQWCEQPFFNDFFGQASGFSHFAVLKKNFRQSVLGKCIEHFSSG